MPKTFEALKRAEEERRLRLETPSITLEPRKAKISSQTVEEYHRMKYKILSSGRNHPIKVLLFCSCCPAEGNSTVLTLFALTLASGGEKVYLVDANLRTPSLHKAFHLERENGLTELCFGTRNLEEVVKKTHFDNLWVITSGIPHANPLTIFQDRVLDSHIEQMKARADWVLFDSPPVKNYTDPISLAGKVDGMVMVVQAEKTRWEVARHNIERLENGNGKILGVILNKRQFYIPNWLYKTL